MKSVSVPAIKDSVGVVTKFVEGELESYDCTPKAIYQIEVAIEEIMVNIVSYAQLPEDDDVQVTCEVLSDPLRVVVQFIDGGIPFDPLSIPDPDISPEALEQRIGGLGIFMVKRMMSDVSYAHCDGKNVLTVSKDLE